MKSGPSAPSARLLRAVAAERADLARRQEALLQSRGRLRAQLEEIDAVLDELAQRLALISRLAGKELESARPPRTGIDPELGASTQRPRSVLTGPAIRIAAVRVLRAHPRQPEAMHYREWFSLLNDAGYSVAGKDPLAVFLTQLSRSPLVRRGTQSGVYELELQAPARLRHQLEGLHAELRKLTSSSPSTTADLSLIRGERTALNQQIAKIERALEEAEEALREDAQADGLAAAV